VSPDKQGRILVPSWLQEAADLDGSVLMIGAIDRVELWNPERFSVRVPASGPDLGTFGSQIFG
jgi:MraZ protein